jgi:hypothetical protein
MILPPPPLHLNSRDGECVVLAEPQNAAYHRAACSALTPH